MSNVCNDGAENPNLPSIDVLNAIIRYLTAFRFARRLADARIVQDIPYEVQNCSNTRYLCPGLTFCIASSDWLRIQVVFYSGR